MKATTQLLSAQLLSASVSLLFIAMPAHADKTTIISPSTQVNNADSSNQANGQPQNLANNNTAGIFNKDSLAMVRMPKPSTFATANQKLLTENAKLEREVNDLQTQVNVLVNERSGQLFLYGVFTAFASFFLGGFLSWLFFSRRKRW